MTRTKWMRLLVRDLSEVVRWAGRQNARQIDEFRYRVVNGRESVSFRLVPAYPIQVGTLDIIVVCHVRVGALRLLMARAARLLRRFAGQIGEAIARLPRRPEENPAAAALPHEAEVRTLPWVRTISPSAS